MKDKVVFETFREFSLYDISNLKIDSPTCFNNSVRVKKYKVTVEEIKEPKEVIFERLQGLFDGCDNCRDIKSIKGTAKKLGLELKTD